MSRKCRPGMRGIVPVSVPACRNPSASHPGRPCTSVLVAHGPARPLHQYQPSHHAGTHAEAPSPLVALERVFDGSGSQNAACHCTTGRLMKPLPRNTRLSSARGQHCLTGRYGCCRSRLRDRQPEQGGHGSVSPRNLRPAATAGSPGPDLRPSGLDKTPRQITRWSVVERLWRSHVFVIFP